MAAAGKILIVDDDEHIRELASLYLQKEGFEVIAAGDADVDVRGTGDSADFHGFTAYFGINGRAHITGSDVAVIVVGKDIDLHVVGKGWAYLKGRGTFEVNNRGPFPWNDAGRFALMEPEGDAS